MNYNLKEYLLFREDINRELLNGEVDSNFKMVANPWSEERQYEEGNIVYSEVQVVDGATGSETALAWWRANTKTTIGVFIATEWDMVGGVGMVNPDIILNDAFGKVIVNSITPGTYNSGTVTLSAVNPSDTLRLVAGSGMSLLHDASTNSIQFISTGGVGTINEGSNIGLGEDVYAGMSADNLTFRGFQATNSGSGAILSVSSSASDIIFNVNESLINLEDINAGAPLIGMLSDVSSTAPTNLDILQWDSGSSMWAPTSLGSLGVSSVYLASSTISDVTRTVTLNANTSGQFTFKSNSDTSGFGIKNSGTQFKLGTDSNSISGSTFLDLRIDDTEDYQINFENVAASGDSSIRFKTGANQMTVGVSFDFESFGIRNTGKLQGEGLDLFTITDVGIIYMQDLIATGSDSTEAFIPFVESTASLAPGRLRTLTDGIGYSFIETNPSGNSSNGRQFSINSSLSTGTEKHGLRVVNIPNDSATETDYGILVQAVKSDFASWDSSRSISSKLSSNVVGSIATVDLGYVFDTGSSYNISIGVNSIVTNALDPLTDAAVGVISALDGDHPYQYGLASIFTSNALTDSTSASIGLYSDVVNGNDDATSLISIDGNWAGYFVGCVNISDGGLVLGKSATIPDCNSVTGDDIEERTLWIDNDNNLKLGEKIIASESLIERFSLGNAGGGNQTPSLDLVNYSRFFILKTAASDGDTILLPDPQSLTKGIEITIKDGTGNASGVNFSVATVNTRQIDNDTSVVVNGDYDSVTLINQDNQYWII